MKNSLAILFCFFIAFKVHCQSGTGDSPQPSLDSIARQLKIQDDVTGFIYTCLDTFLANPTEKRLTIFDQCDRLLWRTLKTNDEHVAYIILQCNKGYYAGLFGDIDKAVDAYERAWEMYNASTPSGVDIIEYCLKPLGNNYSILGDYQSAANVIRNYLLIAERESNSSHQIAAFINLSVVYHDTGRQEEAIELLKKGLEVKGIRGLKKGIIYSNLARNYLDLQRKTEAYRSALQAMQQLKKADVKEGALYLVNTLKILSMTSLGEGDVKEAIRFIEQARSIVNANPSLFKRRELAKLLGEHASLQVLQQQDDFALQNYQQALMLLLPGYNPENGVDLPDKALFYPENAIKEILDGLAQLFSKTDPMKALECFELSFEVEDLLRHTYHYQADRLQQQVEIRNRTEQCLTLLFNLFEETKGQHLVLRAFQLAERTKAIVLREAIEASTKNRFVKHDSLLIKEHGLTFKKAKLASDLVQEQMKGETANVEYINELMARQTALSIEIKSLQKLITKKYPQHNAAEHKHSIDVDQLQQKLARENATLVEYLATKEILYAFIVDAQSISFHKITEGTKIYDHIRTLNDLFSSASRINNEVSLYKRIAFELTGLLNIPILTTTKNLVIIPDGLLNYVPFEALLTEETNSVNYATFPYLLKTFTIAYGSSATNFADYKNSVLLKDSDVLAVFPVFKNTSRKLTHSETEARSIQSYVSGTFLFDDRATKSAFAENLHRYNIIHLSTHAAAGSWLEPPSIDFIDSTLYLPEVYGLQLQPELMILSACETGVGKVLKGEGALSLARGFQYAGANNIIFSLWNVNDRSTASLMSSFYKHYFDHQSKPGALQRAKLDYLENDEVSNAHKSPYYWAPFVYYGDIGNANIRQEPKIGWLETLLLVLTFLFLVVLFFRIRKRRIS
jgi:tetratricopeptide (TPR) repeat protein